MKEKGKAKETGARKLDLWRERYSRNKSAYDGELVRMTEREALYKGTKKIKPAEDARQAQSAAHVRNITAELVESQVSTAIPQPKVTALHKEDEWLAQLIEDYLRNELDRLPTEYKNDMEERTVPIQGGAYSHIEWDGRKRTHLTRGALRVTGRHPSEVIPQAGVTTDIEDMDYIFLVLSQTKAAIKRRYGVDVEDESEDAGEAKEGRSTEQDLVTQYIAYYRNDKGGIGIFSWVGDQVLEDLEDYQARQGYICDKCGQSGDGVECAWCGSKKFTRGPEGYEVLTQDILRSDGTVIPAWTEVEVPAETLGLPGLIGHGQPSAYVERVPTKIPYYKPDVYPVVLRRNVSLHGKLLGDSDVDKIQDQQETIKKLETKVIEKVLKGGSVLTLPQGVNLEQSDGELRVTRLKDPAQKALIDLYTLQPDISKDMALLSQAYEEARQELGITDAFQGRRDPTATSGVAKEFSARQSAGRLDSKRVMKEAAYSRLFEVMFKFALAYTDEPRTVVSTDNQGNRKYSEFNRYDFLKRDAAGELYWNTDFLFSVDPSATLAQNREALWQEARLNYQQGCYGDPNSTRTRLVFWTRMEQLHYPGAGDMKTTFEQQLKMEEAAAEAASQQASTVGQLVQGGAPAVQNVEGASGYTPELAAPAEIGGMPV